MSKFFNVIKVEKLGSLRFFMFCKEIFRKFQVIMTVSVK